MSTTHIPTCFSTLSCPDWTWHDLLRHGPAFGYDGVEIRLLQRETNLLVVPEFQPGQLAARRRELSDAGFRVCGLASSCHFHDADLATRREQLGVGRRYLELARELGASFVRVFGDVIDPSEPDAVIRRVAEGLDELGGAAESIGVDVLLETHGDFVGSPAVVATMQQVRSPRVGVLWDTHHPWRFLGEAPADTLQQLGPWTRHTHWKDSVTRPRMAPEESASPTRGDAHDHAAQQAHLLMSGHREANYVLFGGGEFPAFDCVRGLRQRGYAGWYCLEWEKMWHPDIEPPEIALPLFPSKIRWLCEAADRMA